MLDMLTVPMLKEAAEPFNEANELAKAASTGDPNNYLANMAKAVEKFKKAKPMFEEVLKIDPKNEQAQTYIDACNDNIKSFNDYKDSLDN
jgi:tetratricopeptide (TPR) repeat protein